MLARAVGRERLAEDAPLARDVSSSTPSMRRSMGTKNTRAQISDETGFPGRPSNRWLPSRPKSSGLPGRMAIFQKSSSSPSGLERGRDQIVFADRGAADRDEDIGGAAGAGERDDAFAARRWRCRAASPRRHGARSAPPAHRDRGDDLIGLRAPSPAARPHCRWQGSPPAACGVPAASAWPMAAASISSRGPSRVPAVSSTLALGEVLPARADMTARPEAVLDDDGPRPSRRRSPG